MNGKKVKALRKKIYGEYSIKERRTYIVANGGLVNTGFRGRYRMEKKKSTGILFEING